MALRDSEVGAAALWATAAITAERSGIEVPGFDGAHPALAARACAVIAAAALDALARAGGDPAQVIARAVDAAVLGSPAA